MKKNLLLISIEDLNDWIEPLGGHPAAHTPNLNYLASISTNFTQAYATSPACSPSRTSALFSTPPWVTGIQTNNSRWYDAFEESTDQSIFGILSTHGYTCQGSGKIFHPAKCRPKNDFNWYSDPFKEKHPAVSQAVKSGDWNRRSDFGVSDSPKEFYDEMHVKDLACRIKKGSEGQIWAAGIFLPHLPFITRKEYFDLIDTSKLFPPGLENGVLDYSNKPKLSKAADIFIKQFSNNGRTLLKHGEYKHFLHSYLACISHADALVGQLLDKLKSENLMDNTFVCLWSDHGWQLGEKLCFRKFTLWERALRIPLMICGPSIKAKSTESPASLLDLAPTLLELLNVEVPKKFHGVSQKDLLLEKSLTHANQYIPSTWCVGKYKQAATLRYNNYRYIRYWTGSEELYHHPSDKYEVNNIINECNNFPLTEARNIAKDLIKKSSRTFIKGNNG